MSAKKKWRTKPLWINGAGHNNTEIFLSESGLFVAHLKDFTDLCRQKAADLYL